MEPPQLPSGQERLCHGQTGSREGTEGRESRESSEGIEGNMGREGREGSRDRELPTRSQSAGNWGGREGMDGVDGCGVALCVCTVERENRSELQHICLSLSCRCSGDSDLPLALQGVTTQGQDDNSTLM